MIRADALPIHLYSFDYFAGHKVRFRPNEDMGYAESMGRRNYLIEGVSCSGKTTVCNKLRERGYHVINGDTDWLLWALAIAGAVVLGLIVLRTVRVGVRAAP